MAKEELMQFEGTVTEKLPNAMFRVSLDNDHEVIATVASLLNSGKITLVGNFRGADVRVS